MYVLLYGIALYQLVMKWIKITGNILKITWLLFWAAMATIVLFVPITLAAFCSRTGNLSFTISKVWAWMVRLAAFVRVDITGKENIQKGQSYVIISNHQSFFDIIALVTTLGIQYRWIIKQELLKVPLFGYALYASRNIFIDRSNSQRARQSIKKGIDRLPGGASILFFAEGTRQPPGTLGQFKKGGFMVAMQNDLPILPVTVNGSAKVLPRKGVVFSPGKIHVVVDRPIITEGYDRDNLEELMENTRGVIGANMTFSFIQE